MSINFCITDSIDCSFAKADLEHQYDAFCRLPINSMLSTLFTKGVVTLQQKQNIERTQKNNGDGMTVFVDLVLESLQQKVPDKYVGFRETLKSSDDKLLQQMAAKLSKQNNDISIIIQQLNVLLYNTLNRSLTHYIEIRQAISQ